jgi:hypothetical protein
MTSPVAQPMRSPWQGKRVVAPNLPSHKGFKANDARLPSGLSIARAR